MSNRRAANSAAASGRGCRPGLGAPLLALLVMAWIGTSGDARADTIVLKSGEVIEGSIIDATRNTVIVQRVIGGMRQMPIREIQEVRIDLAQGQRIAGQLLSWDDGVYQVRSGGQLMRIGEAGILSREAGEQATAQRTRGLPPRPAAPQTLRMATAPVTTAPEDRAEDGAAPAREQRPAQRPEGEAPSPAAGEQQSVAAAEETGPSTGAEQRGAAREEPSPAAGEEQSAAAPEETGPSTGAEQRGAAAEAPSPAAGEEQSATAAQETAPSTGAEQREAAAEETGPRTGVEQPGAATEEPSPADDQEQSVAAAEETGRATAGEKRSAVVGEEKSPAADEEQEGAAGEQQRPAADDEERLAAVDEKQSPATGEKESLAVRASVAPAEPGVSDMVFKIELSRPAEQTVVLIYGTVEGTAKAGEDFEPQQGIVTLAPGAESAEVRVPLLGSASQGEKRFELFLTADPKVAEIVDRRVVATINDGAD